MAKGGKKSERLDGGAELEAMESDINYMPRTVAVKKANSVIGKLKNIKEDKCSTA